MNIIGHEKYVSNWKSKYSKDRKQAKYFYAGSLWADEMEKLKGEGPLTVEIVKKARENVCNQHRGLKDWLGTPLLSFLATVWQYGDELLSDPIANTFSNMMLSEFIPFRARAARALTTNTVLDYLEDPANRRKRNATILADVLPTTELLDSFDWMTGDKFFVRDRLPILHLNFNDSNWSDKLENDCKHAKELVRARENAKYRRNYRGL